MVGELIEKNTNDILFNRTVNIVGRKNLNINQTIFDKVIEYFMPEKKEPVVEVEEAEQKSLLTDEDREDILSVIDPLLAQAKRTPPVTKAKPKFSYLTALFFANVYKNYHDKRIITIAVDRYKWVKSTIERNNQEIIDCTSRIEALKIENESFKKKNTRILVGYDPEQIEKVKEEIDKLNKVKKAQ